MGFSASFWDFWAAEVRPSPESLLRRSPQSMQRWLPSHRIFLRQLCLAENLGCTTDTTGISQFAEIFMGNIWWYRLRWIVRSFRQTQVCLSNYKRWRCLPSVTVFVWTSILKWLPSTHVFRCKTPEGVSAGISLKMWLTSMVLCGPQNN